MGFRRTFQVIWWAALLLVTGLLLLARWEAMATGQGTAFDLGLLAIFTAVAAVPLISRSAFFRAGAGEADVAFATSNPPVPDSILDEWRREIGDAVRGVTGEAPHRAPQEGLPENVLVAFTSRYRVELELRHLWERVFREAPPRRGLELLVDPLVSAGALPTDLARAVEAVSRVASPAVHAQPISEAKVRFLQEVVPEVAAALREARTKT